MDAQQKAEAALIIQRDLRATLRSVVADVTPDPDEQLQLASAVIGILLRDMYRQRGQDWLERTLKMVLQPFD